VKSNAKRTNAETNTTQNEPHMTVFMDEFVLKQIWFGFTDNEIINCIIKCEVIHSIYPLLALEITCPF